MPFEKGKSGNPAGRIKGAPTKDTKRFKEALNGLLEHCADDMIGWLEQIDDPKQRFDVLKDFAEYIYPKLGRTNIELTGKDGKDLSIVGILETIDGRSSSLPNTPE
jgi:hypothetical protein